MAKKRSLLNADFMNISMKDVDGFEIELVRENSGRAVFNFDRSGLDTLKQLIDMVADPACLPGQGCTLEEDGSSPNL